MASQGLNPEAANGLAGVDTWKVTILRHKRCERLGIPKLYWDSSPSYWGQKVWNPPFGRRNLLILGPNGVGKSCFAACLARYDGCLAYWYSMPWLLMRYDARFGAREDTQCELIEEVTGLRAIVLDDVMRVRQTPTGLWLVYNILNRRLEAQLITIVTTDKKLQEIDAIDPAIASRLASFDRIVLKGPDRRLEA